MTLRFWVVLVTGLLACSGDNLVLPEEGRPTNIKIVEGDGQSGLSGSPLALPLTAMVTDGLERPVADQPVVFTFPGSNGSEPSVDTIMTDANGRASTEWVLSSAAGVQQLRAAVILDGEVSPTLAVTFRATATANAADRVLLVSGSNQKGAVRSALPDSLVVKVVDVFGNPVVGTTVQWSVVLGGGTVNPATVVTGADGRAATQRVLGPSAGTQRAQAAVAGLKGSPIAFQQTAEAANPAQLLYVSGNNSQGPAGTQLAQPLMVRLVDENGNGIGGRSVSWVVEAQSGSVNPVVATTDAEGYASTRWTLSSAVGTNRVNAVFSGLPSVPFAATGTADVPKNILLNAGNNQTGTVSTDLSTPLSVKITDAQNIPVAGVAVTWAAQGGGFVDGETTTITATDNNGIARVTRTLGALPKAYTTTATRTGLTGSPVTFTSTGTIGAASRLAIVTQPAASAASGAPLAPQPVIQLQDLAGNPVPQAGVSVAAAVSGGVPLDGTRSVQTDANGRATFTNLAISSAPGLYTIVFTSGALLQATSNSIQLTAGAAAKLAIVTQPSATAPSGQAFAQQPIIEVQDAAGNPVGGAGRIVTVELASGSGVLEGTLSRTTIASSRATFTNLEITGAASAAHTLRFQSAGLTDVVSSAITLSAGGATQVAVNGGNNQTAAAGSVLPTDPSVVVRDAGGNPVSGVSVTFAVASGGGSVTAATTTSNGSGIATVGSWQLGATVGTNTLTATAPGLAGSPITFTATGTAGAATKLVIVTQPSASVTSGQEFPQQPVVEVQDAAGNAVTTAGRTVTVTILTGGGTLDGNASMQTDANGHATFTNLAISGGTGSRTLRFASTGLTAVNSSAIAVGSGAATQIAVNGGNNQTAVVGSVLPTDPSVVVRDASGNPVSGVSVTFAVASGGGSVTGATATSNGSGIAAVGSWQLGAAAGTNTLTATAPGLAGSPITFTATGTVGAATKLAIVTQPSASVTSGQDFPQQPVVEVQDAAGNAVTTAGRTVTVTIFTGGGTLDGDASVQTDANGHATFTNLAISGSAGNRTLRFASTGLTVVNSSAIAVGAGTATQIAVNGGNNQTAAVGSVLPTDPSVIVRDAGGNPIAGVQVTFAVALGGGSVTGATATSNGSGIATVGSWQLGAAAGTNTLTATAPGLAGSPITFTATGTVGAATKLAIVTQPSASVTSGQDFPQQPVVEVQDAAGNAVTTAGRTVTVTIFTGGGTLDGDASVQTDANGHATFTNLAISGSAGNRTLRFASTGLTVVNSSAIAVGSGAATQIAVNGGNNQTAVVGSVLPTDPSVIVRDAGGNPIAGVQVTFAVALGGGSVTGATATSNGSGIATVGSWQLGAAAGTNTLTATAPGLAGSPITFTATGTAGVATKLAIVTQPSASVTSGQEFPQQPVVEVQDAAGNAVTTAGRTVTVTIFTGGGTLDGDASVQTDANGHATFTNLAISGSAGNRTLRFASTGLTVVNSSAIAVGAGTATQIAVNGGNNQTAAAGSVLPTDPSVVVRDAGGNPVSGVSVTFAVASGDGSVTAATTTSNGSGIATVGSWQLGATAGTNTLTATAPGLAGSPITFTATGTAGAATKLAIVTQPSASVTSGQEFPQQPVVEVQDAAGNAVTTAGRTVTVTILTGGGTLDGDASVQTDANGHATFTNLAISGSAGNRTLRFASTGLTAVNSSTVAVGAGTATQVAVNGGNNQTAAAGTVLPTDPSVIVRDAGGNPVSGVQVTFAVALGGGSVTGATATSNGSGIATVGSWQLGAAVGTNTLTATAPGLLGSPITFTATATAGVATKLAIVTQPSASVTSGQEFPQQPVVEVQDAAGNAVTTAGRTVTVTIFTGGGTLDGDASVQTDANGHATFTNLAISGSAGNRTLRFASTGLTVVNSSTVAVAAGAATQIAVQNGDDQTATVGTVLPTDPSVIVRDAGGNPVAGVSVTFAVASGGGSITGASQVTNASGVATVGSWQLGNTAGPNTLTATSSGLSGSPVTFTATGTGIATSTTIISSDNSTVVGTLVTFTATVSSGNGTPTGSVRWTVNGTEVSVVSLSGGHATYATDDLPVGSHAVRAAYLGSGSHAQSTSAPLTQTVAKAATTTTITSDNPDESSVGQTITVAFTVTSGFGTPTGTVTVTASGGSESCSASVAAGSCDLELTGAGVRTLTATYAGDASHTGSSDTESHEVTTPNSPPQANDDLYDMAQGETLTRSAANGVLQNDEDAESSPLTVTLVGPAPEGTFDLNTDGSFSYTPPSDFTGAVTFTYRVSDGLAQSGLATVTINVAPTP